MENFYLCSFTESCKNSCQTNKNSTQIWASSPTHAVYPSVQPSEGSRASTFWLFNLCLPTGKSSRAGGTLPANYMLSFLLPPPHLVPKHLLPRLHCYGSPGYRGVTSANAARTEGPRALATASLWNLLMADRALSTVESLWSQRSGLQPSYCWLSLACWLQSFRHFTFCKFSCQNWCLKAA